MTTQLEKPLSRELLIGGDPYKVVMSPDSLTVTAKGHRKGVTVSWESVIALGRLEGERRPAESRTDMPEPIAADVARELRTATDALTRAGTALERAGALPAALLTGVEADPLYGQREHRSGWFIEPLLTMQEVASILRHSPRAVVRLPVRSLSVDGQTRYR